MQCLRRCAVALVVAGVALAAVLAGLAFSASGWLAAEDDRAPADAIVVLGHDPTRVFQAADLYREGLAPRVILSRPRRAPRQEYLDAQGIPVPWFEVAGVKILQDRGVPPAAISIISEEVISTWTEAHAFARHAPDARRLLVVTSPYHVRRSRLVFRKALPDHDIRVIASRYEELPTRWWREQDTAISVTMEFIKLPFFLFGGRMQPEPR